MTVNPEFARSVMGSVMERLGWVLIHSLWQLAIAALLANVAIRGMRRQSAAMRYGVLVFVMCLSVMAPAATWMIQHVGGPAVSKSGTGTARITQDLTISKPASESQTNVSSLIPAISKHTRSWLEVVASGLRPWLAWIVAAWGMGVVFCSARPLLGWRTLWRLRYVGLSPVSEDVRATLQRVSERLGVRRAVRVYLSTIVRVPVVIGYVRPVILLPLGLITSLSISQLEAILAHELAHVRRHDFVVNLLQTWVETLFFYHPAVWWLSHQIRVEREHCCDDWVVKLLDNRIEYGRALVAVGEYLDGNGALALAATDGPLLSRVRRIVGVGPDHAAKSFSALAPAPLVGFVTLGLALMIAVASLVTTRAEDEAPRVQRRNDSVRKQVPKELEPFQGVWPMDICDSENLALSAPQDVVKTWKWTIQGNEIVWSRSAGDVWHLTFSVDPARSPKELSLTYLDGPFKGVTCLGIYEWGGTEQTMLMMSVQDPGAKVARPKRISMTSGEETSLIFLNPRETSEKPAFARPPSKPQVESGRTAVEHPLTRELASFQGTWRFEIIQTDGWPKPQGKGPDALGRGDERQWTIKGKEIAWLSPQGEEVKVAFTIDPAKSPKQIDVMFLSGPHKGKKCLGIYERGGLNGVVLWLCLTDPGSKADRPTDVSFVSHEGRTMIGLIRVMSP